MKQLLVDALLELNVETLIFPTFTFSFCNNEDYDIQNTPTSMGMLPEYVRKLDGVIRTDDPILSVAILGESKGLDKMIGISPCGEGGIFHALKKSGKNIKFLFFGTKVTKCFTYLHYVEEIKHVPYRYSRSFSGAVINDGRKTNRDVELYVRYKGVIPTLPASFGSDLIEKGIMIERQLGNSSVSAVKEKEAYDYISRLIENNSYTFSIMPQGCELIKEFSYGNVTTM